jgi:hypothetical protein
MLTWRFSDTRTRRLLTRTASATRSAPTAPTRPLTSRTASDAGERASHLPTPVRAPRRFRAYLVLSPRICPGRHLATDTIFIVAVSVIAAYKILKPLDAAGNELTPEVAYTPGLFRSVVSFPSLCRRLSDISLLFAAGRNHLDIASSRGRRRLRRWWVQMSERRRVVALFIICKFFFTHAVEFSIAEIKSLLHRMSDLRRRVLGPLKRFPETETSHSYTEATVLGRERIYFSSLIILSQPAWRGDSTMQTTVIVLGRSAIANTSRPLTSLPRVREYWGDWR